MNRFVFVFLLSILIISCQDIIPEFNGEESFTFLEKQCELGPRYPGSDEIELCRNYIIDELKKSGAEIQKQEFTSIIKEQEYKGVNIIASFYPRMSRRILLGAHYDTRPWADKEEDASLHNEPIIGANDAASGVAVLLEIASIISDKQPGQFGIDMVFFDLEDMGEYGNNTTWCLGSSYFAENFTEEKPEKAIVVDMIGDSDLQIEMEYFSYHNSPDLVNEVWNTAKELGFSEFKPKITNMIYDDHYPLICAGFNAIDIIDFDYPVWHTLEDTPDKCSPNSLYVVGQTLLTIIYSEK
ncbi:MAG: M28 family peptidase [Candidatus Cloacimonetes bacterium]|nr:M28 family peptidase [Candidatus Cloacimonadota bacterium]